jgi:hypothetical protein
MPEDAGGRICLATGTDIPQEPIVDWREPVESCLDHAMSVIEDRALSDDEYSVSSPAGWHRHILRSVGPGAAIDAERVRRKENINEEDRST